MADRVGVIVGNFALTSGNNAERMNEFMNWSGMCLYIRKAHTKTMYIELIKLCMWINWRWQAATRTETAVCKCLVVIVKRNKKTREHRQDEQNEERSWCSVGPVRLLRRSRRWCWWGGDVVWWWCCCSRSRCTAVAATSGLTRLAIKVQANMNFCLSWPGLAGQRDGVYKW